jgi:hypothetical protein
MRLTRRIIASRANSKRSRGPQTGQGKHRCSLNAIRHGLLSKCVVTAEESHEIFDTLLHQYAVNLQPAHDVQLTHVEEMVTASGKCAASGPSKPNSGAKPPPVGLKPRRSAASPALSATSPASLKSISSSATRLASTTPTSRVQPDTATCPSNEARAMRRYRSAGACNEKTPVSAAAFPRLPGAVRRPAQPRSE